jgi:hypothetical protein
VWVEIRVNKAMQRAMFSSVSGSRPERVVGSGVGVEGAGAGAWAQVLFLRADWMLEFRSEGRPSASVLKLVEIRSEGG